MIKFFRKIRYKLLGEGKTGKYLKYAIGEILLVVIGILIALSINNWNEERKLRELERTYLLGILDDLKTDATSINSVVLPNFMNNHRIKHRYLDSLDSNNLLSNETLVSKAASPMNLSHSGLSFHPTVGTYNSLISEGDNRLIQDRDLLNAIQKLYEVWYKRNNEYGSRRDKLMDDIKLKHTVTFKYETKMQQFQNKQLLADLYLLFQKKREYVNLINDIEKEIVIVIKRIENLVVK